jgi:hypothetical protein
MYPCLPIARCLDNIILPLDLVLCKGIREGVFEGPRIETSFVQMVCSPIIESGKS